MFHQLEEFSYISQPCHFFFRFVVTVNKNGIVGDVRNALISSVKKQDQYMNANDVIITEAKNSAYLSVLVSGHNKKSCIFSQKCDICIITYI